MQESKRHWQRLEQNAQRQKVRLSNTLTLKLDDNPLVFTFKF